MRQLLPVSLCLLFLFKLNITRAQEITTDTITADDSILTDDTEHIQHLIDQAAAGDTIRLTAQKTYHLRTITLKSGVSLYMKGLIKQLAPDTVADFTWAKQYSNYPLFYGNGVKDVSLSFKASTYGEAVRLDSCQQISISHAWMQGDTTKLRSFSGIYLFQCQQIHMDSITVSRYGMKRKSPDYYQRGTGIRIQTCQDVHVSKSNVGYNGENGIFLHSCSNVDLRRNNIHHNGMSGIQVAFGSTGKEVNYQIIANHLEANAADAIDINNPDTSRLVPIRAVIRGNVSRGNGWVNGAKTRDGSGIATLVGLKNVRVEHNRSTHSNRPAVYVRECDTIHVVDNVADNFAEIVGQGGEIRFVKNTFAGLRLMRDLNADKLVLDSNTITYLAIHTGIKVNSLVFTGNNLKGNINVNMDGHLIFKDNVLSSKSLRGAISLWKVNGALVAGNQISADTTSDALYIHEKARNVVVESNTILSPCVCIRDAGSPQLKIVQNTLASKAMGEEAFSLISSNPKDLLLRKNSYHPDGEKRIRRISLEGPGKVTMDAGARNFL